MHCRPTACIIVFISIFLSLQRADAGEPDNVCPPAVDRPKSIFHSNTKQVITPPASPGETEFLMRQMSSEDITARTVAIMALALGGNIDAFTKLLDSEDASGIFIYALKYSNADGTRCLDPVIEKAIIEHLHDRFLSRGMHAFLSRNLYRSRELFDLLIKEKLSTADPRPYIETARSLTATGQSAVEAQILSAAVKLPPPDTSKLKWVLPEIHQIFIKYFDNRGYVPAIDYMQNVLHIADHNESNEHLRDRFFQTRRLIYKALDDFGTEQSQKILLAQLGYLTRSPRDNVFVAELSTLGEYIVRHAVTDQQKEQAVRRLAEILEKKSRAEKRKKEKHDEDIIQADPTDLRIQNVVAELLAEIGTSFSGRVLLRQMQKAASTEDRTVSQALIPKILIDLSDLPETIDFDVPAFLKTVAKLDERDRLFLVPDILVRYRHPDGHAYLLSQLDYIVSSGERFTESYGYDYKTAYQHLVDLLIRHDDPESLSQTRAEIDKLFQDGKLEESLYVQTSRKLTKLIGDESPLLRSTLEKKETAAREKKRQLKKQAETEWQKQFEEQIAEHMSPGGIRKNIQALSSYGHEARTAARWLIAAGPDVLPYAHEALEDPSSSTTLKLQVFSVLGAVGDARSVAPIINTIRLYGKNSVVYKEGFFALSQIPWNQASFDFAAELLEHKHDPLIQRSALVYFAFLRDQRARKWAEHFSAPDSHDPEVRSAGLYLAARIGEHKVKIPIIDLLKGRLERSHQEVLLRALAEITAPDEFRKLTGRLKIRQDAGVFKNALLISEFNSSGAEAKSQFAEKMLRSEYFFDRREGVRYLIENNRIEILRKYLSLDSPIGLLPDMPLEIVAIQSPLGQMVMVESRKMGLGIKRSAEGIILLKRENQPK